MPKTLTLTLPDEIYQRLEEEARKKGKSVEEVVVERIDRVWAGGALKEYALKGRSFEEIIRLEEEAAEAGFAED